MLSKTTIYYFCSVGYRDLLCNDINLKVSALRVEFMRELIRSKYLHVEKREEWLIVVEWMKREKFAIKLLYDIQSVIYHKRVKVSFL